MTETTYKDETPREVRTVLENARATGDRLRIWYGDTATGRAWQEENDVLGKIGRSCGRIRVPLLIHNRNSMGGHAILDHCIVRIDRTSDGRTLYQHPTFSTGFEEKLIDDDANMRHLGLNWIVRDRERTQCARFRSYEAAQRWLDFMNGHRYAK